MKLISPANLRSWSYNFHLPLLFLTISDINGCFNFDFTVRFIYLHTVKLITIRFCLATWRYKAKQVIQVIAILCWLITIPLLIPICQELEAAIRGLVGALPSLDLSAPLLDRPLRALRGGGIHRHILLILILSGSC